MPATSRTSLRLLAARQAAGSSNKPPQIPNQAIPHMRLLAAVFGKSIFEIATRVHSKTRVHGN